MTANLNDAVPHPDQKFVGGDVVYIHLGETDENDRPMTSAARVLFCYSVHDRIGLFYVLEPVNPDYCDHVVRDDLRIAATKDSPLTAFNGKTTREVWKNAPLLSFRPFQFSSEEKIHPTMRELAEGSFVVGSDEEE